MALPPPAPPPGPPPYVPGQPPPGFSPPPPRQRGRGCLLTFLAAALLGLLAVTAGPAVFYYAWYKPRAYLESWAGDGSLGVGPSTFSVITDHGDSETYELGYAADCGRGCTDDLVEETTRFAQDNDLAMTRADVDGCYRSGCVRRLTHEGHKMRIWFGQVVRDEYQFTITLYY